MKRFLMLCLSLLILSTVVSFDVGNNSSDPPGCTVTQLQQADQATLLFSMPELETDVFVYRQTNNLYWSNQLVAMRTPDAFVYPDYGLCNSMSDYNLSNLRSNTVENNNQLAGNNQYLGYNPTIRHVLYSFS